MRQGVQADTLPRPAPQEEETPPCNFNTTITTSLYGGYDFVHFIDFEGHILRAVFSANFPPASGSITLTDTGEKPLAISTSGGSTSPADGRSFSASLGLEYLLTTSHPTQRSLHTIQMTAIRNLSGS
jgi:hypothetical protein